MSGRNYLLFVIGFGLSFLVQVMPASAKERHYEQVRVLLISRMASCVSCHTTAAGNKLNTYGERIAAQPKSMPLADRIARLERDAKGGRKQNGDETAADDRDVDGDGVPNWVEILARKSPANAKDKPDAETAERIQSVVSCNICHKDGGPGEGRGRKPHNEFGELLAKTGRGAKGAPKAKDDREARKSAERVSILARLLQVRTKKPKGSAATFWQRLRLLHAPADAIDKVTPEEVKKLKKEIAAIKREKKKTPKRGLDCKAHRNDGFLLDGEGLE
ncbi:MAG TPA: hypothetical protein VJZ71_06415 [Phycisphaerae bacterium]|nr:hypothetical protein [Phycisphaerae bacterium]